MSELLIFYTQVSMCVFVFIHVCVCMYIISQLILISESRTVPPLQSSISAACSRLKVKVIPQQAEVAQGVPGRLRPRIFLTSGTTRVVGRQPYEPATFAPG
jgi:hypothetical protein